MVMHVFWFPIAQKAKTNFVFGDCFFTCIVLCKKKASNHIIEKHVSYVGIILPFVEVDSVILLKS
jgi:hypothetical protein